MFLGVHQCMTGMYDTKVCSCITRTQLRAVQTGMYYPIYSKIWKGQRIYNSERNLDVTQCCGNVLTSTRWRVREQVKFRMDNLVLGRHPPWRPNFLWVSDKILRYVRDNEGGLGVKFSYLWRDQIQIKAPSKTPISSHVITLSLGAPTDVAGALQKIWTMQLSISQARFHRLTRSLLLDRCSSKNSRTSNANYNCNLP